MDASTVTMTESAYTAAVTTLFYAYVDWREECFRLARGETDTASEIAKACRYAGSVDELKDRLADVSG